MTASLFYDNCHIISRQLPGHTARQHPVITETNDSILQEKQGPETELPKHLFHSGQLQMCSSLVE